MNFKIDLGKIVKVVLVPETSTHTSEVTVVSVDDNMVDKVTSTMIVNLYNAMLTLTLWEGEAYKEIGSWTNEDVIKRIKELLVP